MARTIFGVGVRNNLWQWKPGAPEFYPKTAPAANGGGLQGFADTGDGVLLLGAPDHDSGDARGRIDRSAVPAITTPMMGDRETDLSGGQR